MGFSVNGYRFVNTDIFEINELLKVWRKTVKKLTREKITEIFAYDMIRVIDDAVCVGNTLPDNPLSGAWLRLEDEQKKQKSSSNKYDFDFDISIFPHEGQFYGMIFCNQTEWKDEIKQSGMLEEYHWGDYEKPVNIQQKEWDERGKVWRAIFKDDTRPSGNSFVVECASPKHGYYDITKDEVIERANRIPFEERLIRVATDIITAKRSKIVTEEQQVDSDWFAFAYGITEWLEGEHGQFAIKVEEAHLAKFLPEKFTKEML